MHHLHWRWQHQSMQQQPMKLHLLTSSVAIQCNPLGHQLHRPVTWRTPTTAIVNVTTADTADLDDDALSTASAISVGAGTASIGAQQPMKLTFAAITTVASGATLSVTNYVDQVTWRTSPTTALSMSPLPMMVLTWLMTRCPPPTPSPLVRHCINRCSAAHEAAFGDITTVATGATLSVTNYVDQ